MRTRAEITRAHERAMYAYVFEEDVSARFRGYHEVTRRDRFRALYASFLGEKLAACFPLFVGVLDAPTVEQVVAHRIEMRDGRDPRADADYYAERCAAVIEGHPQEDMLLELLRIERAIFVARHDPEMDAAALVDQAQALSRRDLEAISACDLGGLHYVELRTSLKESIPTLTQGTRLLMWTVHLPAPRHSVVFAAGGNVHHRLFSSPEELVGLVARLAGARRSGGPS